MAQLVSIDVENTESFGILLVSRKDLVISSNRPAPEILAVSSHRLVTASLDELIEPVFSAHSTAGLRRVRVVNASRPSFTWVQSSPLLLEGLRVLLLWPNTAE